MLFLSGGGSGGKSKEIDSAFIKSLDKSKPVLYIPLAREAPYEPCLVWIKNNFASYRFNNIKMVNNFNELKSIDLKNYSGVYIGGGNTFKLLMELREAGFMNKLIAYHKSNGIIAGGSAGAIIFGKSIKSSPDSNEVKLKDFAGANLVREFSIACHFDEKEEQFLLDLVRTKKEKIIALPEDSGIIVSKKGSIVCGKGNVYLLEEKEKNILKPGQKIW